MFTGLIQGKGRIAQISRRAGEARLSVRPLFAMLDFTQGESIAVNGACLTVESFDAKSFSAYASGETLERTNLGDLAVGGEVNLERALCLGDRLGGHLVSGHVDALCRVEKITPAGDSKIYRLSCPAEQARHIVPKGSAALDGVSLTINAAGPDWFEVNVIPATQSATTVGAWQEGRMVNLETDIIGKYVERMLRSFTPGGGDGGGAPGLDLEFFRKHGF